MKQASSLLPTVRFSFIASLLFLLLPGCTKTPAKPNILFIFADDQCYSTVHALGNTEIHTPNLDRLVTNGVTFTHTYNMGAWHGAVCVASRAMLNTGRFVWRAFAAEKEYEQLVDRGELWGQLMQQAGYDTYMTGKWHVKADAEKLFHTVRHVRPGMPKTVPEAYNRPLNPDDTQWKPWDQQRGGYWEGGKHWSEVVGDHALGFIRTAQQSENPFFMYLAFNAPHDPRQSPKEFVDRYPLENISVPESFLPEYPYKDGIGCGPSLRDEKLAPFPRTEYAVKVHRQEYYAIITHMDQQIGRILDALKEADLDDNTYIFFTADHGLAVGHQGLIGKQNMYDHSMRVPLMVVGPDVPKNQKRDMDVYLQDIMASTIELAGLEKPASVDFNSLMPLIRGERKDSYYPEIYGCYTPKLQRMIRTNGYKLIVYPQIKKLRLFNVNRDPLEMNDLAEDPQYKEIRQELFEKLVRLQEEMEDPLDLQQIFQNQ